MPILPPTAGPLRAGLAVPLATASMAVFAVWWCGSLQPDLANRLRDDAFYEFTWAANLAAGRGPSVSDGVSTSGVQLLWSLLLVPLVWLFGPAALPALAPWLGALLHAAAAAAWWRCTRPRTVGVALACLWLGNPLLLRECQNGQETALACLMASLLWLCRRSSEATAVGLAVLAVFARSELWLLAVAVAWLRHGCAWRALLAPAVSAGVWLCACRALGGGWLPDSASPMAWLWHQQPAVGPGQWWWARPALLGGPFRVASAMGIGTAVFLLLRSRWPRSLRALPAVGVGVARAVGVRDLATPAWAALLLVLLPASGRRRLPRGVLAVLASLAGIVALHWAVRWYPRDYYLAPLVVAAMVAWQRLGRLRPVLLVAALAQLADVGRSAPENLSGQRESQLAGQWLSTFVPAGARVGCWNAGIVTFTAAVLPTATERRAIVNLDGVVDARSFAALRRGELQAWLDAEGVRFLLDHPAQVSVDPQVPHGNGRFFGGGFDPARDLVEVARFDEPGVDSGRPGTDSVRLYWRRGRGDAPTAGTSRLLGLDALRRHVVAWAARSGEVLELVQADGGSEVVAAAEVDTVIVLPVPSARQLRWLQVRGGRAPLLVLPPL